MGVAVVLAFLAIIAALSGLLTDPLQAHLGIHERRLRRMVRHLGKDLQEAGNASYHPRDPYLARVVDAVDAIRGPLGWVRMGAVKDGLTPMATWENKKSWLEEWSPKMALLNTPAVSVTAALSAEEGRNGDRG